MILTYNYNIGIGAGKYPCGTKITDSLLGIGLVSSISYDSQSYNKSFTQDLTNCTLDFSGLISLVDGDIITIHFQNPIVLQLA